MVCVMQSLTNQFVNFVKQEDRVVNSDCLEPLDDPTGHRANVGPPVEMEWDSQMSNYGGPSLSPVSPDVGLVTGSAQ